MPDRSEWIQIEATVTSCRFQFARMNTLTMGIPTSGKFRIAFDYYAHGRVYTGEFQSPNAIPQNDKIPLLYNPLHPEENTYSAGQVLGAGGKLIARGIAGSVILSLIWLMFLRGCN